MMRFELGFLAGFQGNFLHLPNNLFREDVVQQFAVRHVVSVLLF